MELNKNQLIKVCRYILYNTDVVVEEKYSKFLIERVFSRHQEWEEKKGVGIDHLEVRPNRYKQKNFYIVRIDGSVTDISFLKALQHPTKLSVVKEACRNAILPIILEIRSEIQLPFKCPLTGETVTDKKLIHVDHYDLTFDEVFNKWIEDKNINELYEKVAKSQDNSEQTYFEDDAISKDFLDFHNKNTHLRVISAKANLSLLKKNK